MKLTDLLDQIQRLDQETTPGPWHIAPEEDEGGNKFPWAIFGPKNDLWGPQGWDHEHYIQEIPELTIPDAEFIALARTALPQLAKSLRAVLELHTSQWSGHIPPGGYVCETCLEPVESEPCQTVRTITDALGEDLNVTR